MLRSPLACLAIICGVSCGEPPSSSAPVTLRVGASSGLSSFRSRTLSGDTSHAMELVYSLVREHAELEPLDATRVRLRAKASSPLSHSSLCARLLDDAGVERRTPTAEGCVLEFESSEAKSRFEGYPWLMVDHGPFQWEREISIDERAVDTHARAPRAGQPRGVIHVAHVAHVALAARQVAHAASGWPKKAGPLPADDGSIRTVEMVSRSGTPIDRIHITAMPLHEAWRRLFARQLDVIPNMSWLYRPHFSGMRSVRTIDVPVSAYMHVFFNTRLAEWADPDLRRHVARIVEPHALAMLACGDPVCAIDSWRPVPPAAAVEPPPELTIRVLSSHSSAVTTAQAISYRIRLHHEVHIDVERVPIETLAQIEEHGDYDLVLAPMGTLTSNDPGLVAESLSAFAGYDSPDFIAAAERGDVAEMQRILERDVPALPLYELRTFAAVDARFCGGQPGHATSWAWLVELRPCAGEEAP